MIWLTFVTNKNTTMGYLASGFEMINVFGDNHIFSLSYKDDNHSRWFQEMQQSSDPKSDSQQKKLNALFYIVSIGLTKEFVLYDKRQPKIFWLIEFNQFSSLNRFRFFCDMNIQT